MYFRQITSQNTSLKYVTLISFANKTNTTTIKTKIKSQKTDIEFSFSGHFQDFSHFHDFSSSLF